IYKSCKNYFHNNPYDIWFKSLNNLLSDTEFSYYSDKNRACHLDLIPYATEYKWTELSLPQRKSLIDLAGDTLGLLLQNSPVDLLVLNGNTVIQGLQRLSNIKFNATHNKSWDLPRKTGIAVKGYSYTGSIQEISGIKLKKN